MPFQDAIEDTLDNIAPCLSASDDDFHPAKWIHGKCYRYVVKGFDHGFNFIPFGNELLAGHHFIIIAMSINVAAYIQKSHSRL